MNITNAEDSMALDLSSYPFLCISPDWVSSEQGVSYHITDCANLDSFAERWSAQDDELRDEFNYDLPVVWDFNCIPIQDFTKTEVFDEDEIREVRDVTFDEYVEIVRQAMTQR